MYIEIYIYMTNTQEMCGKEVVNICNPRSFFFWGFCTEGVSGGAFRWQLAWRINKGIFKRHRDAFPARKPVEEKVVYPCLSMFIPLFTRFWLHPGWLALGFLNHQEYLTRLQDPTQGGDTMSWDPSTCLRACRFVALRSKLNFCKAT